MCLANITCMSILSVIRCVLTSFYATELMAFILWLCFNWKQRVDIDWWPLAHLKWSSLSANGSGERLQLPRNREKWTSVIPSVQKSRGSRAPRPPRWIAFAGEHDSMWCPDDVELSPAFPLSLISDHPMALHPVFSPPG